MNLTVACPTGCAGALPQVSFDKCVPDIRLAEFTHLLLGKGDAAAFADWTSAPEWAGRLSQTDAGDKIRILTIRGNKPATTKTEQTLTRNRKVVTNRHHVVNITIDEVNDDNYDLARTTQCGIILFRAWLVNNDTKDIFGGNPGILGTLFLEPIYDEGTGVLVKFVGTFEWDAMQDPQRATNPIAGL